VGVILLGLHQFAMVKIIKLNKRVRNGHKKYQKSQKEIKRAKTETELKTRVLQA